MLLTNLYLEAIEAAEEIKLAADLLNHSNINYVGFAEGSAMFSGDYDVIVTDGFSGNIALKTAEGVSKFITDSLKRSLTSSFYSKFLSLMLKNKFLDFRNLIDPRNYNGGIFIGINGVVIKSHGNADSHSFANAIEFGIKCIQSDLLTKIKENVSS